MRPQLPSLPTGEQQPNGPATTSSSSDINKPSDMSHWPPLIVIGPQGDVVLRSKEEHAAPDNTAGLPDMSLFDKRLTEEAKEASEAGIKATSYIYTKVVVEKGSLFELLHGAKAKHHPPYPPPPKKWKELNADEF